MKRFDKTMVNWTLVYKHYFPELILSSQKHQPCPYCGGKDRFRLFGDWPDSGAAICNQCGKGDGVYWLMKILEKDFLEIVSIIQMHQFPSVKGLRPVFEQPLEDIEKRRRYLKQTLQKAVPLKLNLRNCVTQYLRYRGLGLLIQQDDSPGNLFYARSLIYKHEGEKVQYFGCLLAALQDVDGNLVGVHRIYLSADGRKAPVSAPKKSLPSVYKGAMHGAAVRLYPATTSLGITEGLETALAVRCMHPSLPVWATLTAGGMKTLRLPAELNDVHIFVDHDQSGEGFNAASILVCRLRKEGRKVTVHHPKRHLPEACYGDWLDVWCLGAEI
uniref:Bll0064 protein n=1 Tax=Rheinheimera sp. BAL341 TaxID=1708203 RepID=A0A486XT97_9GAMM